MLERTKKHSIKKIVLTFAGPVSKKSKAVELMKSIGFRDTTDADSISLQEASPELKDNAQGTALTGARHKEGLTQREVSDLSGIPQRHISEMETGKRPIGKKNARLLGDILKVDYRVFM